jgi:hypothetical protein
MFKLFIIAFSFWVTTGPLPPKSLDFEDRTLQKELLKISGTEHPEWKELAVPPAFTAGYVLQGKYMTLSGTPDNLKKYVYIGRVNSCRQGGCSNPVETIGIETPEYFDYLILFDAGLSVQLVKVYNYQATHGQEITNKGWLKQFQGYNGNRSLTVGKSIDAISGATVSVQVITADVQEKTQLLKRLVNGEN